MHIRQSAHTHGEQLRQLSFQSSPGTTYISGPGIGRKPLCACKTGTLQVKKAGTRIIQTVLIIQHLIPVVTKNIVHLISRTVHMPDIGRMTLGLAQITPPAGNAPVDLCFVLCPEPRPGRGFEDIDQSARTKIKLVVDIGFPQTVGGQYAQLIRNLKIRDTVDDIGFGDQYGFYALLFEGADHLIRIRPGRFVPVEPTQMPEDTVAEPVEIEYQCIDREILLFHEGHNAVGFSLVAVGHARLQISQCPAGRHLLAAGQGGIFPLQTFEIACGHHIITQCSSGSIPFHHIRLGFADIHIAFYRIVEQKHVVLLRKHQRHRIIQHGSPGLIAVKRAVIKRQAVIPAIHGH